MAAKRRVRKAKQQSRKGKGTAPSSAPVSVAQQTAPRTKKKMPDAMRDAGVDETYIAETFATHLEGLKTGTKSNLPRKLLLDYLKECVRILYAPARRGDAPEKPSTIELVHFIPRPDRSESNPPAAGS